MEQKWWAVYDSNEETENGGDMIVALCTTKEKAEEMAQALAEEDLLETRKWIKAQKQTDWAHYQAYILTMAMDVTRYYIEEVKI